ncbi:MAG TPA: hypothetical protein VKZ58_06930 [Longimicrobiales bacterium]|nr:hypothetical protein [Longimicrobiales bacterium]
MRNEALIVSEGTLRPEDLIPAFIHALKERLDEVEPQGHDTAHTRRYIREIEERIETIPDYYETADSGWDLVGLSDALNDYAPEGMYFGAHEGDGALYGFWPIEPAEDEEEGAAIYGAYDEEAGF